MNETYNIARHGIERDEKYDYTYEDGYDTTGYGTVHRTQDEAYEYEDWLGVGLVGQKAIYGNIVACAVVLKSTYDLSRICLKRERLSETNTNHLPPTDKEIKEVSNYIVSKCYDFSYGEATPEEIKKLGINEAGKLAMRRALNNIESLCSKEEEKEEEEEYFNFGYSCIYSNFETLPEEYAEIITVKTDVKDQPNCLMSALNMARDKRIDEMKKADEEHKGYNFSENKGYGTFNHLKAIAEFGVLSGHRECQVIF